MAKAEIGQLYTHSKSGKGPYRVVGFARHTENLEEMVLYQALYESEDKKFPPGTVWARPRAMWEDSIELNGEMIGRFIPYEPDKKKV